MYFMLKSNLIICILNIGLKISRNAKKNESKTNIKKSTKIY